MPPKRVTGLSDDSDDDIPQPSVPSWYNSATRQQQSGVNSNANNNNNNNNNTHTGNNSRSTTPTNNVTQQQQSTDVLSARRAALAQQQGGNSSALRAQNIVIPSSASSSSQQQQQQQVNPNNNNNAGSVENRGRSESPSSNADQQQQRPPLPTSSNNNNNNNPTSTTTSTTIAASSSSSSSSTTEQQLEELRKLRTSVSLKQEHLQTSKKKEQELDAQLRRMKSEHEQRTKITEDEANRLRQEIESERARQHDILDKATQEHEQFVRSERARIEKEVGHAVDPELKKLQEDVERLRDEKKSLQQQITTANSSGSEVDRLLTDAVTKVLGKMNATFEEKFKADEAFVDTVRDIVKTEVKDSFVSRAQDEELEERAQYAQDFEEMLHQWKVAEEQERYHVLRQDEQLLADLQSIAHESLDQIQKEELALQQSFLSQREQWMRSHRAALQAEMEASLQRRSIEFEEIRSLRREAFASKLKDLEDQHLADMQRDREVYEAKMESIRETANMRQKMHEEKTKLLKDVQKETENAIGELKDVVLNVSSAVDRVDDYRRSVDDARTIVVRDQDRLAAERKVMLEECQQILNEQIHHIEHERKLLSEGTAKLDTAHNMLQRQLTEERAWAQETHTRVERSRSEWEREYRKWQQVAAQERRAAEQRFSDSMRELNNLSAAIEEETQAIESEIDSLHRRTEDRSRSVKNELDALHDREKQTQQRTEAVSQVVSDLEGRSRQLGLEWQKLQAQKHELLSQRRELEQEEARMAALAEQLHLMRGQALSLQSDAATARERKKNIDANLRAAREMMNAQSEAIRNDAHTRRHTSNSNSNNPRSTAQQHAPPSSIYATFRSGDGTRSSHDRLPMKLMSEIKGMLGGGGWNDDHDNDDNVNIENKNNNNRKSSSHYQPRQDNNNTNNNNNKHQRQNRSRQVETVLQRHGIVVQPQPSSNNNNNNNNHNRTTTMTSATNQSQVSFTPLVNLSADDSASVSY